MGDLRSTEDRKSDVLAVLEQNGDLWLATANASGRPHLIAVSSWWDGTHLVIATTRGSRTARNLDDTGLGRVAVGSPNDAIMIDIRVLDSVPVAEADSELKAGFIAAAGWDPGDEGTDWRFFRLMPLRIQAYRGYGELSGREVMRDSRWLAG